MRVQKRDGRVEDWNGSKIVSAISKAAVEAGEEIKEFCVLLSKIESKAQGKETILVSEVHKMVEDVLMGSRYKKTARAYIEKRSERDRERELNGGLWKAVEGFISQSSDEFIRENANKAATVVSTHRDLLAGIMSKHYAISHILDKEVAEAHLRGVIHQHDLDYSLSPLTNCLLVNYTDMLEKGFKIGDASIERPKSIGTAATVLTQIAQAVASSTYGGQTNAHIDFGLKPYVEASYKKLKAEQQRWGMPDSWVEEKIDKEVFDAMQSILYQINSLTTTNGQSPFYTISLGLDTSKFGRMITKNYLKVHMEGIGANKTTPTFPKVIFFLEEGVNMNKEDPNYDLKQMAVECSAKRIYPDYVSVPKNKEITGAKGLPVSPMGCVDGKEVITYKYNGRVLVESFERMWDRLSYDFTPTLQENKTDEYIKTENLEIFDSSANSFVNVPCVIKNWSNDWYKVKLRGGRSIVCTGNHPLPTQEGRKYVKDLLIGDVVPLVSKQYSESTKQVEEDYAWLLGMVMCDGCYPDTLRISIAGVGEDDIEQKIYTSAKKYLDLDMKTILQTRRGTTQYKDVVCYGGSKGINKKCEVLFGGKQKAFRHFPEDVFTWDEEARMAFLAGIVDADGYINGHTNGYSRVQVGSTNKELAIQQMLLANSLGLDAKMYENRYTKKNPDKIRYRVEFNAVEDFVKKMACEKKKVKIKPAPRCWTFNKEGEVYEIEKLNYEQPSYDVTTESDKFDVSGINSHNCRSFLSCWTDENGKEILDSRFNLGVVSINLPYVALEAAKDVQMFWERLEHYCELSYKAHMDRVERLKGTKAKQNPTLWMHGAIARLEPEQTIDHLFYGGFASISIGYIGLSETVSILCGGENKDFALSVLQFMKRKCEEFKNRSNIGFSVYGTPSESYCNKAAQAVKRDFGEDAVSKTYLTNSFHVPVWEQKHPMFKWGYEKGFAELSSGGNIVYVEAPNLSRNLQAYEGLLDYAYHTGMHYFAVNTPVDQCYKCGYEGEFEAHLDGYTCPSCGNNEPGTISVLRRVSGYVSAPNSRPFNAAKQAEVMDRKKHVKG